VLTAETLAPELDLIDTRIVHPSKELVDICKKIRKTITKRDHKLVDYDRHNNSLNKLREKKEKSLSDEKNLFKVCGKLRPARQLVVEGGLNPVQTLISGRTRL
jgi:hypothetical protein